ncbi:hypothetical protein HK099_000773, partial [Clydaea vesicula]
MKYVCSQWGISDNPNNKYQLILKCTEGLPGYSDEDYIRSYFYHTAEECISNGKKDIQTFISNNSNIRSKKKDQYILSIQDINGNFKHIAT